MTSTPMTLSYIEGRFCFLNLKSYYLKYRATTAVVFKRSSISLLLLMTISNVYCTRVYFPSYIIVPEIARINFTLE